MPTYEYRCDDCGQCYDAVRSYQERELPCTCPHCASMRSQVLFSLSFQVMHGSPTSPSAAGRATAGPRTGAQAHRADHVEPRHPLPAHWGRYPRNLGEAI